MAIHYKFEHIISLACRYTSTNPKSTVIATHFATYCTGFDAQRDAPVGKTCPRTVKLWTSSRQYDGGGEFVVIADTSAIAGPARLVRSNTKSAEFTAPLKSNFADCVGQAASREEMLNGYSFRFQNRTVTFRVQLPPDTPSNPSGIAYKGVVSSRPAVKWQIAD